jgi:hypothetical protein
MYVCVRVRVLPKQPNYNQKFDISLISNQTDCKTAKHVAQQRITAKKNAFTLPLEEKSNDLKWQLVFF